MTDSATLNWDRRIPSAFAEYVHGTEQERLDYERAHPGADQHEHERVYEPWPAEEAARLRRIARSLLDDPYHRAGHHGDYSRLARESCSTCVLNGYEPQGGFGDGYSVKRDGPNYAGWARVYVEAGRIIPAAWRQAFALQGSDNAAYYNALGRDLVTFGHPGFSE